MNQSKESQLLRITHDCGSQVENEEITVEGMSTKERMTQGTAQQTRTNFNDSNQSRLNGTLKRNYNEKLERKLSFDLSFIHSELFIFEWSSLFEASTLLLSLIVFCLFLITPLLFPCFL